MVAAFQLCMKWIRLSPLIRTVSEMLDFVENRDVDRWICEA